MVAPKRVVVTTTTPKGVIFRRDQVVRPNCLKITPLELPQLPIFNSAAPAFILIAPAPAFIASRVGGRCF